MKNKKKRSGRGSLPSLSFRKVIKRGKIQFLVDVPKTLGGVRQRFFFQSQAGAQEFAETKSREFLAVGQSAFAVEEKGTKVADAVEQFLPRLGDRSKSHRGNAERVLHAIAAKHGDLDIAALSPLLLDTWLRRRTNENTRARDFRYLRLFCNWAYRMELIEKNPVVRLESPRSTPSRGILTPEQMADLLAQEMPDWLRAHLVLGGFAGLRTEEMLRMDWGAVDVAEGEIHVAPGVQKDSGGWRERYVAFTEPLRRLLVVGTGAVLPVNKTAFFKARRELAEKVGWAGWPKNCLRHSFASYHLAECGNAAQTAHQMGHTSSAMVYRTYARAVRKAQAARWWGI